jgi:2-polyprenyl-3-methyl-5-hydroxy-6-metoxy-1,4-benzoquinol methylase
LEICKYYELWMNHLYKMLNNESKLVFSKYYHNYVDSFNEFLCYVINQRLLELHDKLENETGLNILDIGAGTGSESIFMALHGHHVTGIDINRQRLKVAKERKKIAEEYWNKKLLCEFREENLLDHKPENLYDLIWMEETFHHLEPREKILVRLSELLKKDGCVIMTEINGYNPLNQIKFFVKRGFKTVKVKNININGENKKIIYGNERILFPRKLSILMRQKGFVNTRYRYFRVFTVAFSRWLGIRHTIKFEKILSNLPLVFLFVHYNFVAEK